MSERYPSPELVRFLTTYWPLSSETIGAVRTCLPELTPQQWLGFDRNRIESDLANLIAHVDESSTVISLARPVVLCVFGHGQDGKSTFTNLLGKQGHIETFSTDSFVCRLREDWHDSNQLRQLAVTHAPHSIDQFIRKVQGSETLGKDFIRLFFDPANGFNYKSPLSAIEGFLRHPDYDPVIRLDQRIVSELKKRGYKVWVARTASRSGLDQ